MSPYKLTYYYLGRGRWLNHLQRDDDLISDCKIQKVYFRHPELEKIEFELIYWRVDDRVDIKASSLPLNKKLKFLFDKSICAYPAKFKNEDVLVFELQQPIFDNHSHLHPTTIKQLSENLKINLEEYFIEAQMIAFGSKKKFLTNNNIGADSDVVIFERYHDGKFIDAFKASILAPVLDDYERKKIITQEFTRPTITNVQKEIVERKIALDNRYRNSLFGQYIQVIIFVIIVFGGCVTYGTRQRTGCNCRDGTESSATGQGACSHHDGVSYWHYKYWWD